MNGRWLELEALFNQAVVLDGQKQTALVAAVRERDCTLADELTLLLNADQPADETNFLNRSPVRSPLRLHDAYLGRRFGPYVLKQKLGEGGMGVVFLAEQQHPIVRPVAVKLIAALPNESRMQQRFEFEIQALARLNHPHIAAVYSAAATDAGLPYFAMEYVDGLPLDQYCMAKALDYQAILSLFRLVCRAVHAAHQQGIIHRDLKPANILVTEINGESHPKIIDFGIAKTVYAASLDDVRRDLRGVALTEVAAGTMGYMSPEQTMAPAVPLDVRCDVYALGVILYELLVGDLPVGRDILSQLSWPDYVALMRYHQPEKPSHKLFSQTSPDDLQGDKRWAKWWYRDDIDHLCLKALAIDPDDRYQSAQDLAEDCLNFLEIKPLQAAPDGLLYHLLCFLRRRRRLALGGALLMLLLLTTIGGTTFSVVRTQQAERKARREQTATEQSVLLLNQIFASVTAPNHGNQALVADQLNTLAPQINRLQVQPVVRAQLNHAVGEAYRAMGRYTLAEQYLTQAWQIRRDAIGPYSEPALASFLALGLTKMKLLDPYSAQLFLDSLEKPKVIDRETRMEWVVIMAAKARLAIELDELSRYPVLMNPRGLLARSGTSVSGGNSPADQSWYRQMNLLLSLMALKRNDWKAAGSFLQGLESVTEPKGPDRHLYLEGSLLFAQAYNNIRTRHLAQEKLNLALREIRETYHENHPMVLQARLIQCEIWLEDNQLKKALSGLCEVSDVLTQDFEDAMLKLDWITLVYTAGSKGGEHEWGRHLLDDYLAQHLWPDRPGLLGVRQRLLQAKALLDENELAAFDIAHDAYRLMDDLGHPSPGWSARTAQSIGKMYASRGRFGEAEDWACVARSFAESIYGYSGYGTHEFIDDHLTAMLHSRNPRLPEEISAMQATIEDQSHNMKRLWFRLKELERGETL